MVPPSVSAPRNSSSLLRSDRRWPGARITVAVLGLEFGDIAQPAQGSDRHRRSIQPLAQARDVELDRVRARFVVEPEKLLGEIRLAQHPAEAAEENFQQPVFAVGKLYGGPDDGDLPGRALEHHVAVASAEEHTAGLQSRMRIQSDGLRL